jgi:hypothetical protein
MGGEPVKKTMIILALLFASAGLVAQDVAVSCTASTLGQTYSTSAPSLQTLLTGLPPGKPTAQLMIANPTSVAICATPAKGTSAPSTFSSYEHCVPPTSVAIFSNIQFPTASTLRIYLRADKADCTSGVFYVDFW